MKTPKCYVSESGPNGFVLHEASASPAEITEGLAIACLEFGHRLAKEGKTIKDVQVARTWNPFEISRQTHVRVKISHTLKGPSNPEANP